MNCIEEAGKEYADSFVDRRNAVHGYPEEFKNKEPMFDGFDIAQAFEDGAAWAGKKEWISVKEKLPAINQKVLILTSKGRVSMAYICVPKDKMGNVIGAPDWCGNLEFVLSITHWCPIPEIPLKE